jgi:hypothetical protein
LDQIHVPTSDVLVDLAKVLTIGKFAQLDRAGLEMQKIADLFCQLKIRASTENF